MLNKRYAMTAMHCVEGSTNLVVALGEHNIRQDIESHAVQGIPVERVIRREDYDENSVNNDSRHSTALWMGLTTSLPQSPCCASPGRFSSTRPSSPPASPAGQTGTTGVITTKSAFLEI